MTVDPDMQSLSFNGEKVAVCMCSGCGAMGIRRIESSQIPHNCGCVLTPKIVTNSAHGRVYAYALAEGRAGDPDPWLPAAEMDPHGTDAHEPGAKLDAGKTRAALMTQGFGLALLDVAAVTTYGAQKYTPSGWEYVPDADTRYMDAAFRHLLCREKDSFDADSGHLHLSHAIWNLLAVLELRLRAYPGDVP